MLLDQRPERLLSLSLWVSAQALGVVMASLVDSGGTQTIWLLLLMRLPGSLDEATPPLVVAIQVQISWLSENSSFRNFKFIPKLNQPWSNRWISNLKSPKNLASMASMASMAWMATAGDVSVAVDDRDLNHFALNPSCNVTWRYADHGKSALQVLPMHYQCSNAANLW